MTSGGQEGNTQRILRITDIADEPLEVLSRIEGYEKMPVVSLEEAVETLVDLLPQVQDYAHAAKQRCTNPADQLTPDESASVMLYTMGWKPSDKCLHFALNATLRSEDRRKLKPWLLYLRLLLNALLRLPSISRTICRGVNLDLSKQYVKGRTIVWWGFSSCTADLSFSQSEQLWNTTGKRTLFVINCFDGKDISKHSYYSPNDEILLLPATELKVIDCRKQADLNTIYLQQVTPQLAGLSPVTPSLGKFKQKRIVSFFKN